MIQVIQISIEYIRIFIYVCMYVCVYTCYSNFLYNNDKGITCFAL